MAHRAGWTDVDIDFLMVVGDLLFLSGIRCADEDVRDDIEVETRRAFDRIAAVLAKHGAGDVEAAGLEYLPARKAA